MKMRKSTWLLLVLALAAILLVAGCAPTGPAPTPPDENGEEPPPTPPADTAAPKVVKTMVSRVLDPAEVGWFKITIVFDEDIYSPCAENPNNWEIRVVNSQRREGNRNIRIPVGDFDGIQIVGNQIILYAWVAEEGNPVITYGLVNYGKRRWANHVWDLDDPLRDKIREAENIVDAVNALSAADLLAFLAAHEAEYDALLLALNAAKAALATPGTADDGPASGALDLALQGLALRAVVTGVTDPPRFQGLICSQEDADEYEAAFGIEVTAADVVTWELSNNCAISDILGNSQCGYSGEACCVSPYCEECVECDLTTGVCK